MERVYFIGVAGGSCSGKTTLACELGRRLGETESACISVDSYYRGLSAAERQDLDRYNFDHPDALDHDLLVDHLRGLSRGETIEKPVYDFTTHTRTERIEPLGPVRFVIVEGLFPLHWDAVRALLGTKVFIDAPHDVCLSRRLARDTAERGRPREEVIRRYNEMARAMYERFVLPSKRYADVVVNGERLREEGVAAVMRHIESNRAA
ncbi:MAG: uridine kinase, partial [Candidatus Krumholzibacteriota bacterium]|nr:uridine kinase [Candidatus Krumholzibacteriota bacterium]